MARVTHVYYYLVVLSFPCRLISIYFSSEVFSQKPLPLAISLHLPEQHESCSATVHGSKNRG